jgi:hypothetical protein
VDNFWPLLPDDACQLADSQRIWQRRVMGAASRIDTRETHRSRCEPMYPNPPCKGFLIRDTSHAVRRYRDIVSPLSKGDREVQNVPLLAADIWREELGQQKDAHQYPPEPVIRAMIGQEPVLRASLLLFKGTVLLI